MSDTELSFFENSDFDFGEDSFNEEDLNKIKLNSMSLTVLNEKIYTGQKLKGSVNLYVPKELPPGRIVLKFRTLLKLKTKKVFRPLSLENILKEFKLVYNKKYKKSKTNPNALYPLAEKNRKKEKEGGFINRRDKILPKFMNQNLVNRMIMPMKVKKRKNEITPEEVARLMNQKIIKKSKLKMKLKGNFFFKF